VAVLEIRLYGDPVLTQRSDPVTRFDAELARFGDDLLETLRSAYGAGLAAPQVGVLKRMFAYDIPPDEETGEHPHGVLVTRSSPAGRASRTARRAVSPSRGSSTPAPGPWPSP